MRRETSASAYPYASRKVIPNMCLERQLIIVYVYVFYQEENVFWKVFILQQVINSKTLNAIKILGLSKAKPPVGTAAGSCRAPNRRLASGVIQCRIQMKCKDKDQ